MLEKGSAFSAFPVKRVNKVLLTVTGQKAAFRSSWRDSSIKQQPSKQYVIRFKVPNYSARIKFMDKIKGELSWDLDKIEDFVIARSDGSSTYNLAVVVDDHNMRISHVIRGEDHLTNTVKRLLIYMALDWEPPVYAHIPLIHNERVKNIKGIDKITC